jgi:hypothetical protein
MSTTKFRSVQSFNFKSLLRTQKDIRTTYINYPKVGMILTARRSGYVLTHKNEFKYTIKEGRIIKGNSYVIIDNIDFTRKQLHVHTEDEDVYAVLSPTILKNYFGFRLKKRSECTKEELAVEDL